VLTVMMVLSQLALAPEISNVLAADAASLDVFTQKQPFSGKGPNMPSDAFGPQDVVLLYGQVSANDSAVDKILVAFDIWTPNGANFTLSAFTNTSGIATVNFTIATPPINITQTDVFGLWKVYGSALYVGQTLTDTLTFQVDWIVKLLSVKTIDSNLTQLSSFGDGGEVGLEITLRSIAMILTNATISIVLKDELGFTANFSQVKDFAVQPNNKTLYIFNRASLPKSTHIGNATVFVSALTAPVVGGGVPFCPDVQASFQVTPQNPLSIDLHDVAVVTVMPSANPVAPHQTVELTTMVRNEGTDAETFTVSTYFEDVLLGTAQATALMPYAVMYFSYSINPSAITVGNHTFGATIPPLPNEADLTDNTYNDILMVEMTQPEAGHDIAILSVTTSTNSVFVGDTVGINVVLLNKGNFSETFDLDVHFNNSLVGAQHIVNLASLAQIVASFSWNTSKVNPGTYQISASAPLSEDINPSDNTLIDGLVEVKASQQVHDVAVSNVAPSPTVVNVGQTVLINVTVRNKGMVNESFHVRVYYDDGLVGDKVVTDLMPSTDFLLIFEWNTTGVAPNTYVISAVAGPVPGEIQIVDNTLVDGTVTIRSPLPVLPNELLFFFIVVVIAGIAGIILLFLILALDRIRRRRPRPAYTVIARPHL